MTIPIISAGEVPASFLWSLATAALRALILAGVAGLGLSLFRAKATLVRLFTWTAVLYFALAMPLLEQVLPKMGILTPALLQSSMPPTSNHPVRVAQPIFVSSADGISTSFGREHGGVTSSVAAAEREQSGIRWSRVALFVYVSVASFLLIRFLVGLAFTRRLQRSSQVIRDERIAGTLGARAKSLRLSFVPQATESEFVSVPMTVSILRPTILFPITWRDWDDAKIGAVIAHEMSHVGRRDLVTHRLAALHCAIFWFSPLAWWLNRQLADLAEQASDEAALRHGADRTAYAKTLLGFFEALHGTPGRVWWQGISMASAGRAEQRMERILGWNGSVAMNLKKSVAAMVVMLAAPVVYVVASASPQERKVEAQSSATLALAQAKTPAAPKAPSRTTRVVKKSSNSNFYSYSDDDQQSYVIVSGKSDSLTMSGTGLDKSHLEELRASNPGGFIWFERDGKSYIVRDQSTIDRARSLWAPQEELGKKQEELGAQQEALGKQQEELGAKMEQIRVDVPDMTKELEKLQATVKQLNSSATSEQIAELQSQIGELQGKIGESQSQAGEQQSKLGEQMGALGEQQGKLGEQQGELGRQQGELAHRASQQMKQLLDEAVAKGTAQLEKQGSGSF